MSAVPFDPSPAPVRSVYERIKAMATTFRLRPGERVNEVELARQLGVSRTPVREALGRVAAEGFLVATSNRGYTVRALDAQLILNLYEYRSTVEVAVTKLVCERASDEALADLATFAAQARTDTEHDEQAIRALWLDEAFHERLADLTGNPEYARSIRSVNERIRFARWIDLKLRHTQTRDDHSTITRALQARDVVLAQTLMAQHVLHYLDHVAELTKASYAEIYTGNALADYAEARFLQERAASQQDA